MLSTLSRRARRSRVWRPSHGIPSSPATRPGGGAQHKVSCCQFRVHAGQKWKCGPRLAPGAEVTPATAKHHGQQVTSPSRHRPSLETPYEQLLASGAQGTIRDTDERKAASIRIVDVDSAGDGSRARMLPAVAFAASMRMSDVLITHQRPARPGGLRTRPRRRPEAAIRQTCLRFPSLGSFPTPSRAKPDMSQLKPHRQPAGVRRRRSSRL
jgi:hypothetical protein